MELVLKGRRAFRPYRLRTQRYAVLVAHRRCGKTVACVQGLIDRSTNLALPHGRYAYVGPYLGQAKEVAWEYLKRFAELIIRLCGGDAKETAWEYLKRFAEPIIRLCGGHGRRLWRVVFSGLSARRCSGRYWN
jgi:hypothetical protein